MTSNEGLSSNRVNCIFEDSDGFIWIGTEDGLNLYDGYSIRTFKNSKSDEFSLSNNSVYCMVSDPDNGNLWIGTRNGINYFDKSTYRFHRLFETPDSNNVGNHIVNDLKFDNQNRLWMGTSFGLFCFDKSSNKLDRFSHSSESSSISSDAIKHVFVNTDGRIFIGTQAGLDLFEPENQSFQHLFTKEKLTDVMQVFRDSQGEYWICTNNNGVYKATFGAVPQLFSDKNIESHLKTNDRVHAVLEDNNHNLLFMVRDKGLYCYNRFTKQLLFIEPDIFDSNSLNSKALISSYQSKNGIIWFGTYNRGVNFIDNNRKRFNHFKINYKDDGLFNNNIRSLFQDSQNKIWVGTKEGGGLSQFFPESGTFKNYKSDKSKHGGLSSDYIFSINELDANTLMLGTFGEGIDLFDKQTGKISNLKIVIDGLANVSDNKVYTIFNDLDGIFWVAGMERLFKFKPSDRSFELVSGIESVRCIAQRNRNELWIGTKFDGIRYYNLATNTEKWFKYNKEQSNVISTNNIIAMRFASDSVLWIGTRNGLNKLNVNTLQFKHWTVDDGLAGNWISSLEIDGDGNVWVSTSSGLSKFDPQTNIFRNYYVDDGLQGNEFEMFVSLKAKSGELYFGGSNGFNVFRPREIIDNLKIPKIQFTDFKISNASVAIADKKSPLKKHISKTSEIVLTHKQSDFSFEFVALTFTSPESNNYKYMLEGYDDDWILSGKNRIANYTNISQGNYIFKVTASNNDNVWNNEGISVKVKVLPPPWKTVWAYSIYLIIIGLLVMGLYFVLVNRIEQQTLLKIERHERVEMEQLNQLKLKFFTNISHEFRTPLTLISSPLSKLITSPNIPDNERFYLYQTMNKNVKRLLRLVKQLMDFRKLENQQMKIKVSKGNLHGFIEEIISGFAGYSEINDIKIQFSSEGMFDAEQWFDEHVLDSILFNLLSNAFKFSQRGSTIEINLKVSEEHAVIEVVDFGAGISPESIDKIFDVFYSEGKGESNEYTGTGIGLSFSKSLIELHKGTISVESEPGKRTAFTLTFPINAEAYSSEGHYENESSTFHELSFEPEPIQCDGGINDVKGYKKKSLLLVEDNIELRNYLKNHFQSFHIYEAGNGVEALEIVLERMPDIVISDVMMPKMDGVEFCARLRANFITSHIPVILLTAKTAIEHKIEGIENGADAYIEKPFEIKYLEAQVVSLLKQREMLRKSFSNQWETRPDLLSINLGDKKFFEKAEKAVFDNLENPDFSVEELGEALNMSRSQLFRKFKAITENTPSDYIRTERLKQAKLMLKEGIYNVNEISTRTGFSSPSHFISTFKKYTGFTPREFSEK